MTSGQIITDSFINTLGQKLGPQWRQTAIHLKMDPSRIKQITKENKSGVDAAICFLSLWNKQQQMGDEHKIFLLKTALQKAKRQDLVIFLSDSEVLSLSTV